MGMSQTVGCKVSGQARLFSTRAIAARTLAGHAVVPSWYKTTILEFQACQTGAVPRPVSVLSGVTGPRFFRVRASAYSVCDLHQRLVRYERFSPEGPNLPVTGTALHVTACRFRQRSVQWSEAEQRFDRP